MEGKIGVFLIRSGLGLEVYKVVMYQWVKRFWFGFAMIAQTK